MNVLHSTSCAEAIHSSTKAEIINKLSSLNESDIKNVLFAFLSEHQPLIKPIIQKHYNYSTETAFNHIQKTFCKHLSSSNRKQSKLLSIPSMISAYILSYCSMNERLLLQIISKDFRKICKIPIANDSITIDRNFVEHLFDDQFDLNKFGSISYLNVKFILTERNLLSEYWKQAKITQKYYYLLNRILSRSNIKSIGYQLTYKRHQHTLNQSSLHSAVLFDYGSTGSILTWIKRLNINFESVETLNIIPPIGKRSNWSEDAFVFRQTEMKEFVEYIPNLKTIIIPEFNDDVITNQTSRIHASGLWQIFSNNYYYNTLQYIDINMVSVGVSIFYHQHPLTHFYKFIYLKSLKLCLSIPGNGGNGNRFYKSIYDLAIKHRHKYVCNRLTDIALTFDIDDAETTTLNTMDSIWLYVLSFCNNLLNYTFFINIGFNYNANMSFNHIIGHTDKLQTIVVSDYNVFTLNLNMSSLKSITFDVKSMTSFEELSNNFNSFQNIPYLESFRCIYDCNFYGYRFEWNDSVIQFLQYFQRQSSLLSNLKHIGLINKCKGNSIGSINCDLSLEICKLIISLNVSTNIKFIELSPLMIKQKQYEYLLFWYHGEFGHIDNHIYWRKKNKTFLMDIKFIQKLSKITE